ncbi:MAG: DUF3326 domain-containing protein [Cyanobacteria bacterium J06638_20]
MTQVNSNPYTVVVIVPTGIGAAIGGYAGDALPVVRAIAQVAERVITHPNVLNGASLYWPLSNVSYVEGYGLDQFAAGQWGLRPVHRNRIGLLLDQGIEPELRDRHLQAADATRATLGLDIADYVVTDAPLGLELRTAASGATWGTIRQTDSLLRGAETLIQQLGVEAIAVVARFPDDLDSPALADYRQGKGVDPLAGAEAVISHLIVRQFQVPCAHAPALSPLPFDPTISPRSAAEELGYTFLPCVLAGLSRAPRFIAPESPQYPPLSTQLQPTDIWASQVNAVIVPASACGGAAILSFAQTPTSLITVQENTTQMQVPAETLGLEAIAVSTYLEAIGVLAAHKAGISPTALSATLSPLQPHKG